MENPSIPRLIEQELSDYIQKDSEIDEGIASVNTYAHIQLLDLFDRGVYETGNTDSQGRYKYWFDIISPRVEDEVKSTKINLSNMFLWSPFKADNTAIFLMNAKMRDHLNDSGESEEINDAKEKFSAYGNILWEKTKGGYDQCDFNNTYIINQLAKTIDETPIIHRYEYSQSDLVKMRGIWNDKTIDFLIEQNRKFQIKKTKESRGEATTVPYYELYKRNGEVNLNQLKELQRQMGQKVRIAKADDNKYVLAMVVMASMDGQITDSSDYVLFAKEMKKMPYEEAHRGRYKNTWWRDGLISVLLDLQNRANEVGNQIAKGLEFAAQVIFGSSDVRIAQNILTDLQRGDIIKTKDLKQIDVRLQNMDQLIAEWDRLIREADRLTKSTEISRGEAQPAGTPFKLGNLLDTRGGEFHDYIRQKFALGYRNVIKNWILPQLVQEMKGEDIVKLTGDIKYMNQYYELVVNSWFIKNIETLGRLTPEQKEVVKQEKIAELKQKPNAEVEVKNNIYIGVLNRSFLIITGENVDVQKEVNNQITLINLEPDPVRRTALIEEVYQMLGKDISNLPKSEEKFEPIPQLKQEQEQQKEEVPA